MPKRRYRWLFRPSNSDRHHHGRRTTPTVQAERMALVRLHSDNWVMMPVTLTTPASRFVKPTDVAGQRRLDLTFRLRAWLS